MGGDARIRWISNNGLEMVRKPVKTAVKRHGGGLERRGERTLSVPRRGPQPLSTCGHGKIVEGFTTFDLSQEVRGLTSTLGRSVGISQRCEDPSLMGFGECYLESARIAEGSPIADPLQPQWD